MRIDASPMLSFGNKRPLSSVGTGMPRWERSRICEVPLNKRTSSHTAVSLMPSHPISFSTLPMLHDCCAVMALLREIQNRDHNSISRNVSE
jgi:hypothetical protein